jgi:membrane-associated protease RseP (regulator of RpoE activity)
MPRKLVVALATVAGLLLFASGALAALLIVNGDDDREGEAARSGSKGYLGLTVTAVPPGQGLRIASIIEGGPAEAAGLRVGDIIRSVDGQVVRTPEQLRAAVETKAPGTKVTITYERGEREHQATVRLGEAPPNAQIESTPAPQPGQPGSGGLPNLARRGLLGVQVEDINPALKSRYGLTRDSGVVIVNVQPGSAAARAGLLAGDVITTVNGRAVTSEREVTQAIGRLAAGDKVTLGILRGSQEMTVEVTLGSALDIPGLQDLPAALQERLRELLQSGNLSPEALRRLAMGQYVALGTVKSITDSSLTITRLDMALQPAGDLTYALTEKTQFRSGSGTISRADIRPGARVVVISLDGQSALGVLVLQR